MNKRIVAIGAVGLLSVSTLALAPQSANARAAKPRAAITVLHNKIRTGQAPVFRYSTSHLPTGSKIYLQRQFGTGHVWKSVVKLRRASGTVTAPKLTTMGRYPYRLAVVAHHRYVAYAPYRNVYAYGAVAFSTLCANVGCNTDPSNTIEFGGRVHTYVLEAGSNLYPTYDTAFQVAGTTCNALTLYFYGGSWAQQEESTSYVQIVQERSDPVASHVGPAAVGVLRARLDGSTWYLDASDSDGHDVLVDRASSASCYTASGSR